MNQSVRISAFLVTACVALSSAKDVCATQYTKVINGREVVVHTNPLPVVMHRLVPPQHGRHVTVREIHQGSVPTPGRLVGQRRK
jgi:hypothetical protein